MGFSSVYKRFLRGAVITLGGTLLVTALAFVTRIVLANGLSPQQYGQVVLALGVLNFTTRFTELGFGDGLSRNLARSDRPESIFTSALVIAGGFSLIFAVGLFVTADRVASLLAGPSLVPLLHLVVVAIPLATVFSVLLGGFAGSEDMAGVSLSQVTRQTFIFLVIIVTLFTDGSPVQILAAWVGGSALAVVLGMSLLVHRHGLLTRLRGVVTAIRTEGIPLLRFSVPLLAMGTSITFIQQVDTLLVGYFLTDVSVGVYDAAYIVSKLVTLLVPATVGIALPLLSSLDADERTTEMGRLYRLATKWTILLTFPVFVVLVTVPGRVISLIFNSSYADGSTTLLILAVGFLSMVFAAIARQMLIAVGETTLLLGSSLFALGGNLVLNLALIPSLGIEGAAIATTVSLGSLGLFYVFYLYRRSGVFPLSGALLKTTALSGFGFYAADRFVFAVDSLGSPLFLFVCFLFAITHFSIFVLSGGLVPADIEFIEQLEKKLPFDASGFVRILRRWVS